MKMIKIKFLKMVAMFLVVDMLYISLLPTISYALTSGPSQPEFSSFEPVATTQMVNDFTGDFTYNLPILEVPGPHGSSYPLSLSYHSGVTSEEEASWVGYGWSLNPGAINRSVRGFPDDYNDKEVIQHNKMPKNWTATVGAKVAAELFSKDILALNTSVSLRYNNYRGFGYNAGVGVSLGKGVLNIGYGVSDGNKSYSLNVNPLAIPKSFKKKSQDDISKLKGQAKIDAYKNEFGSIGKSFTSKVIGSAVSYSNYRLFSHSEVAKPTQLQRYDGKSFNFSAGITGTPTPFPAGLSANLFGSYTYQKNVPLEKTSAYGYLYSRNAQDENNSLMDYHVEKESSFSKRDAFLGVPFNDADQYMVTGEGIGGGFRMHHKSIGHFGPRTIKSEMKIFNIGGEFEAGLNFGGGIDLGVGIQKTKLTDWNRNPLGSRFTQVGDNSNVDEPVFFRFNNDLAGSWGDNHDESPVQASNSSGILSAFDYRFDNGRRSGRSSYIGFNFNKDVCEIESYKASYKAYSKREDVNKLANKKNEKYKDYIGEFAIFNEDGLRYIYGLPMYSRNEETMSYGVSGATSDKVKSNYIVYYKNKDVKVGEEKSEPYATSYLLTEITTPDYIDRSLDGPTIDDFGGYTRFNYTKKYGGDGKWYKWRMPYNGLRYQRNSLSDLKDDLGTVSFGEKEVYYLQSVETKSHVAIFYLQDRKDALGAVSEDDALSKNQKSADKLQRLNKIELYPVNAFPKDGSGKLIRKTDGTIDPPRDVPPIKTVHFEYANDSEELCKLAPNTNGGGKLTLKRVYFEYNGIKNTLNGKVRISPYQFEYKYPDFSQYPAKYRRSSKDNVTLPIHDQNPNYSFFNADAWGNYQPNGANRYQNMRTWLDQRQRPNEDFDPAAWHLKVIKLPSGGEIHVQYESDDYQYVQDQEAHVMVNVNRQSDNTYVIDHEAIGIQSNTQQLERLARKIRKRYVHTGKKMYFKFLYKLLGGGTPNLNNCNAEYITGYADVKNVEVRNEQVVIILGGNKLPKQVCEEFVKTQRLGMIDEGADNCNPASGALADGKPASVVRQLLGMVKGIAAPSTICAAFGDGLSYLRVPALLPKRGGGLRVKRLMTFDRGFENNPVLYGSEYIYRTLDEDGHQISSGVATNEPQAIREENILVDFVRRGRQSTWDKIIAGEDKKNQEGPIGESIYPSPTVGYSRVAIRSIHSGTTHTGFTIHDYHTAKDHPIITRMTPISSRTEFGYLFGGFVNSFIKKQWATQGFSFVLNSMHGQPKRLASYTGDYSDIVALSKSAVVSEKSFEYYRPHDRIKLMTSAFGSTEERIIGREVDITLAQKVLTEDMKDANIEIDVTIGIFPFIIPIPIPFATAMPFLTSNQGGVATHATTKVIRYPAIVKKTTTYQDGIYHVSEPLAFDAATGKPAVTRSYDEFVGTYVQQQVKAGWNYPAMKDIASMEGKVVEGNFTLDGNQLKVSSEDICSLSEFVKGDLIELGKNTQALYHVAGIDYLAKSILVVPSQQKLRNVSTVNSIKILRSGRTNSLNTNAGHFTRHSQGTDLNLASVNTANQYSTSDDLVAILNTRIQQVSGTGSFKINKTFSGMNMTDFQKDTGKSINWENAEVRHMEIRYVKNSGRVSIQIMAFDIACGDCPGGWYEVVAKGWKRMF